MTRVILLIVLISSSAFAQSFNFTAVRWRSNSLGSKAEPMTNLLNPKNIVLKDNVLSIINHDGNKWMEDVRITKIIPFKSLPKNNLEAYLLEYQTFGVTVYATYRKFKTETSGDKTFETIIIPAAGIGDFYLYSYTEITSLPD